MMRAHDEERSHDKSRTQRLGRDQICSLITFSLQGINPLKDQLQSTWGGGGPTLIPLY